MTERDTEISTDTASSAPRAEPAPAREVSLRAGAKQLQLLVHSVRGTTMCFTLSLPGA